MAKTAQDELHEASQHLREAHIQLTQARWLLQRNNVTGALSAIAHVEPWLATARRENHHARRALDGR